MQLSDAQIDFIQRDIAAKGISIPQLSDSLLDHICCCMENDPDSTSDFETLYDKHLRRFYNKELWEIEEEALLLILYKNYYTMKKMMILSGLFSVFTMIVGVWFKLMHYPGAAVILPFGIMFGSFVFMPLLLTLKAKEKQSNRDKLVLVTAGLSILLLGLSFINKLLGGFNVHFVSMTLFYLSAATAVLVFLPFYLSSGLRNPATKSNTIVTAVLICMGYTLLFSMMYNKRAAPEYKTMQTYDYLRSQEILYTERQLAQQRKISSDTSNSDISRLIDETCEQAKAAILESETGFKAINEDFESKNILLVDHSIYFDQKLNSAIQALRKLVPEYNSKTKGNMNKIAVKSTFLFPDEKRDHVSVISLLNQITQMQMLVFQNERNMLAIN